MAAIVENVIAVSENIKAIINVSRGLVARDNTEDYQHRPLSRFSVAGILGIISRYRPLYDINDHLSILYNGDTILNDSTHAILCDRYEALNRVIEKDEIFFAIPMITSSEAAEF